MTKFCPNCAREHEERGFFCTDKCMREFNNRKRSERAGTKCRLCGRKYYKRRQTDPVLSEHTATQEPSGCQM